MSRSVANTRLRFAASFAALFLMSFLTAPALRGQGPVFEVASIKLAKPGQTGSSSSIKPGSVLHINNYTLKRLVMNAYDLRDFQLLGTSGWMNTETYDIIAKPEHAEEPPPEMTDSFLKRRTEQMRLRLQALLADRFQLVIHRETKEMPIYALVLAKGELKLKENREGGAGGNMTSNSGRGKASIEGRRSSMEDLAQVLSSQLGRIVQDHSGLAAAFDFKLEWTLEAGPHAPGDTTELPTDPGGPTLFTALQQQLGLRLESRKGPVEVIVIDRAARPSEN